MPRIKRPRLKREGPIRSWPSAMGADGPAPPPSGSSRPQQGVAGDSQDPIRRGVVMGGQVVDEWMKQGQQFARLLGAPPLGGTGWPDASGRMMRAASDFMAAWLTSFGAPMQPGTAPWNGAHWPPAGNGTAAPGNGAGEAAGSHDGVAGDAVQGTRPGSVLSNSRVTLDVTSRRPVEISVVLQCHGLAKLRVLDLRPDEGDAPRIRAPQLEPSDGEGWRLRISVPADQPPGAYHATIIDDDADFAVGSLTVKVRK